MSRREGLFALSGCVTGALVTYGAIGLFDDGETPQIKDAGRNITPDDAVRLQELERRVMGQAYQAAR